MEFVRDCLRHHSLSLGLVVSSVGLGFVLYRYRKWVGGGVCRSKAVLTGKTAIITGANTGIGLETALDLARRGARVILACRSVEKGEAAAEVVRQRTGNQKVLFVRLDLASLDSVRTAANAILQKEQKIDLLINNAGIALRAYAKTKDGFEAHLAVNHLGHFLLTNLLLPSLKAAPSARVITVSSSLYKRCSSIDFYALNSSDPTRYNNKMPGLAYSQSKLANVLFSRSLSKRLLGTGVCTYVLHPGLVPRTELAREFYGFYSLFKKVSRDGIKGLYYTLEEGMQK